MTIWPQITYLALTCMAAGVAIANYGEAKVSRYDWTDFVSSGIVLAILYYGGFFVPLDFAP
jgi:hypothetical protein